MNKEGVKIVKLNKRDKDVNLIYYQKCFAGNRAKSIFSVKSARRHKISDKKQKMIKTHVRNMQLLT